MQKTETIDSNGSAGVAAAGENLAWVTVERTIFAAPLGDPRAKRVLDGVPYATLVAGRGNHLLAIADSHLWHIDVTGAKPATSLMAVPALVSTAVDETHAYYFNRSDGPGTAISRVPLTGGSEQLVASLDGEEEANGNDVAVTTSTVFFRTNAGVRAVSKTERQAPKLVAAGKTAAVTADVDGSGAFWATTSGTIGRLYRADADGTNPRLLAELPFSARTRLTTDETALYVLDPTARTLYRLPKH
jgi:hypothetical protein